MLFSLRNGKHSAAYARNRMKLLLRSEHMECSEQTLLMLQNDLIHTVKRYIPVEEKGVNIQISQEPFMLLIQIPVCQKKD